jgi:hypothetical protein
VELIPPEKWEPMPDGCREFYDKPGGCILYTRFIPQVLQLEQANKIEIEFRNVTNKPDKRNRYWWRIKPAGFPFDRLYVGDVLSCPAPTSSKCRMRVRSIEHYPRSLPGGGTSVEKAPNYTLQLYTVMSDGTGNYGWMDSSHDRHFSLEKIKADGYRLIEKAPGQPTLF